MYYLTFVLATRNLLVSESVWASRKPDFFPELYTSTAMLASVPCKLMLIMLLFRLAYLCGIRAINCSTALAFSLEQLPLQGLSPVCLLLRLSLWGAPGASKPGRGYSFVIQSSTLCVFSYVSLQILEGIATVAVGILAFFSMMSLFHPSDFRSNLPALVVLVDFPSTASFLTPEERAYVIYKKSTFYSLFRCRLCWNFLASAEYDNSTVGEADKFAWRYVWAAFIDWQVWLHILIYMSIIGPCECAACRSSIVTHWYCSVWHITLPAVSEAL